MLIILFILKLSLFVKYNETSTNCDQLHPCNYTYVRNKLKDNCKIFLLDENIRTEEQILDFFLLILEAPINKFEIIGQNTHIDASSYFEQFPLKFFDVQINISNFTFSNFKFPVMYSFNSSKISISNIIFNCQFHIKGFNSNISISNVIYSKFYKSSSSLFYFQSSNVNFNNLTFHDFLMVAKDGNSMILTQNSTLKIKHSNFINLNLHNSNLISSEDNSKLRLNNCQFKNGICSNLIFSYNNSLNSIKNCVFDNNNGILYSSIYTRNSLFENTTFKNNINTVSSLFVSNSTALTFCSNCVFYKNSAVCFIRSYGDSDKLMISDTSFGSNQLLSDLFCLSECNFVVTRTVFKHNLLGGDLIKLLGSCQCSLTEIKIESFFGRSFLFSKDNTIELSDTVFSHPIEATSPFISLYRYSSLSINRVKFLFTSYGNDIIYYDHTSVTMINNSLFNQSLQSIKLRNKIDFNDCQFMSENVINDRSFFSFSLYYFVIYSFILFLTYEILKVFAISPRPKENIAEEEEDIQ